MKKRAGLLGLLALLSGCLFSAAQETAGSKAAKAPCPADAVSFGRDVLPVLQDHCAACHYDTQQWPGLNMATTEAYSALVNQKSGESGDEMLIKPKDPAHSFLLQKVSPKPPAGKQMPSYGRPLSAQELHLIEQWVRQGAQDN